MLSCIAGIPNQYKGMVFRILNTAHEKMISARYRDQPMDRVQVMLDRPGKARFDWDSSTSYQVGRSVQPHIFILNFLPIYIYCAWDEEQHGTAKTLSLNRTIYLEDVHFLFFGQLNTRSLVEVRIFQPPSVLGAQQPGQSVEVSGENGDHSDAEANQAPSNGDQLLVK